MRGVATMSNPRLALGLLQRTALDVREVLLLTLGDPGLALAMRPLIVPGSCDHDRPICDSDHTKITFFSRSTMPPGRKPPAKKAKTSTTKAKQTLPATRNRSKTVRSRKPSSPPASPTPPPYSETIDPTLVDRPDTDVVDPALSRAWQINEHRQMCVIFDCVNPVRQFKRGTVYDETDPNTFPEYNPSPELDEDVTESDEEATLRPYNPKVPLYVLPVPLSRPHCRSLCMTISRKYMIICDFPIERFMYWEAGELLPARLGKLRKRANKNATFHTWKDKQLPQPYARIAEQLNLEDLHGIEDDGHESIRRQAYARFVLEAFGKELDAYKGSAASFRSKVFTPILQRQLQGIPDAYAPTLTRKISLARPCGPVTIHDATAFYLGIDPLNPLCIGGFRRNLIYIREARWHLAVRLGNINVESKDHFEWYLDNHEVVLKALKTEAMKREADHGSNSASESESESESEPVSGSESEDRGKGKGKGKGAGEGMRKHITKQMKKRRKDTFIPPLSYVEVEVILVEELEPFFAEALRKVVCTNPSISTHSL